jgi:NAD+ kinase
MTSTSELQPQSQRVRTASLVTHGRIDVQDAVDRSRTVAAQAGVELVDADGDVAIALGGDGTILRALAKLLGTRTPVIGVNFGRVGFLASISPENLERDLARVFAGEYAVIELPTLEARLNGETFVAVNDVVATSGILGRMIELSWSIAGEDLGTVLVRGLDAMAVTFIAPHSLDARPLVVPRGAELTVRNATPDVAVAVLADGHKVAEMQPDASITIRLGDQRSRLATLPETTFFRRYRETFAS